MPTTPPSGWGREPAVPPEPAPPDPLASRQYFVPAEPDDRVAPSVTTTPPVADVPRPRRRRWGTRRVALVVVAAVVVLVVAFVGYGYLQFRSVERVAVANVLSPAGSGTNYLIVGSDSREGFDPNAPDAGAVLGSGTEGSGQRSDTMLVLRTSADGALMTSIPRDLWVRRPDGTEGRINAAYREGPAALIQTVSQSVGIPVHHYVEVDFVTFAELVGAVGGVTIEIPHPARDLASGLDLPEAGVVTLDEVQALAFVRARHYEELIDGRWVLDPTSDHGRVLRQQQFLRAVMSEVGGTRNPIEVMRVSGALADGLRMDDSMGFLDAVRFARSMRGLEPESLPIPTYGFRTSGGAAVLGLVEPEAAAVIARFG